MKNIKTFEKYTIKKDDKKTDLLDLFKRVKRAKEKEEGELNESLIAKMAQTSKFKPKLLVHAFDNIQEEDFYIIQVSDELIEESILYLLIEHRNDKKTVYYLIYEYEPNTDWNNIKVDDIEGIDIIKSDPIINNPKNFAVRLACHSNVELDADDISDVIHYVREHLELKITAKDLLETLTSI